MVQQLQDERNSMNLKEFNSIGLMCRHHNELIVETLHNLHDYLIRRGHQLYLDENTANQLNNHQAQIMGHDHFGEQCDLIIVVGGDGNLLHGARYAVNHHVPILGVNRGKLGFLTDIRPDEFDTKLAAVLDGEYFEENRFLLNAKLEQNGTVTDCSHALNDVVLKQGDVPHLLEFEIYIDDKFVCSEHADGLIVATPTGSTAYALSGGGPILNPQLDAMVLLPMFSHTLSSRPLVIEGESQVRIKVTENNEVPASIRSDGEDFICVLPGSTIHIHKKQQALRLIHPNDYNYYAALRTKLGWGKKFTATS